ncbi:hypothetical protein S83_068681 [Arachis hypogaea]
MYEILWMCSQLTFFFVFLSWLDKSCQFKFIYGIPKLKGRFQKQHNALSVVSEDQPQSTELDEAALVPESEDAIAEDISTIGNSSFNYWEVMENQALYHSITVHMEKTRRHYRQNQKRVKIASCGLWVLRSLLLLSFFLHSICAKCSPSFSKTLC